MRNLLKSGILLFCSIFLLSGVATAFPFIEVEGYVNTHNAFYSDLGGGLIQFQELEYSFYVTDAADGAKMNYLSLEFEDDVFTSVSEPYNYDPNNWTPSWISSTNSLYLLSDAGSPLGVGEHLSFMVNVIVNEAALSDSSLWGEGQIWAQSWLAGDILRGGDGGSTTPTPEPATMLLFGTGLIGITAFGRKKLFKKE